MNLKLTSPIALAALSLSLTCMAQAPDQPYIPGARRATQLVPAQAALKQTLDAKKLQPGSTFQAVLAAKSQLTNGVTLPAGTILTGEIVADGSSTLSLRFTTAQLKNGQAIPIRATIVNFQQPEDADADSNPVFPGQQLANNWTDQDLKFDQLEALNGVDMHSAVASPDSALFVAHPNKDVKLKAGSELALALAAVQTN